MMEDYIQFSAKTKSEAITKACIELGTSSDQLDIQVVSEGSSGFFGFGSKPAIIKARKIEEISEEKEIEKIVDSVKIESIIEEKKKEDYRKPPVKEPVREKAAKPIKESPAAPVKEKPVKEKEKPVKEKRQEKPEKPEKQQPKEKSVKEKPQKEKSVKVSKPVEILKDAEKIAMVEERAKVFLRDVFQSMNLGEVEITSKYNTSDGSLEVDFEEKIWVS